MCLERTTRKPFLRYLEYRYQLTKWIILMRIDFIPLLHLAGRIKYTSLDLSGSIFQNQINLLRLEYWHDPVLAGVTEQVSTAAIALVDFGWGPLPNWGILFSAIMLLLLSLVISLLNIVGSILSRLSSVAILWSRGVVLRAYISFNQQHWRVVDLPGKERGAKNDRRNAMRVDPIFKFSQRSINNYYIRWRVLTNQKDEILDFLSDGMRFRDSRSIEGNRERTSSEKEVGNLNLDGPVRTNVITSGVVRGRSIPVSYIWRRCSSWLRYKWRELRCRSQWVLWVRSETFLFKQIDWELSIYDEEILMPIYTAL